MLMSIRLYLSCLGVLHILIDMCPFFPTLKQGNDSVIKSIIEMMNAIVQMHLVTFF